MTTKESVDDTKDDMAYLKELKCSKPQKEYIINYLINCW